MPFPSEKISQLLHKNIKAKLDAYKRAQQKARLQMIDMLEEYREWDKRVGVEYFSTDQLSRYLATDLKDLTSESSVSKTKIFVVDDNQHFYLAYPQGIKIHHSSFFHGAPVKYAGTVVFDDYNKPYGITINSGHYKPTADTLLGVLLLWHANDGPIHSINVIERNENCTNARRYLLLESSSFIDRLKQCAGSEDFDLFFTLLSNLPDINFPLYSESRAGEYQPIYPSQILSNYLSPDRLKKQDYDVILRFLSQTKNDVLALQAVLDLLKNAKQMPPAKSPEKNYLIISKLISRNLEIDFLTCGRLNLKQWLPLMLQYGMDFDRHNMAGKTLLSILCQDFVENEALINQILTHGANSNTPVGLYYSRDFNNTFYLVRKNHLHSLAVTPVQMAAKALNLNLFNLLLHHQGSVTNRPINLYKGMTLLQVVIYEQGEERTKLAIIKLIIEKIKDIDGEVNLFSTEGYAAFHSLFLPYCTLSGEGVKMVLQWMSTCKGVNFALKTNTTPKRSLLDLATLYDDRSHLLIDVRLDEQPSLEEGSRKRKRTGRR